MKKIYLAGFDVFYPDAVARGEQMKAACKSVNVCGLYPLDNEVEGVYEIFHGNLLFIDQCDVVAANGNAFRGAEPDSGTSFEIGYAYAKGKPIFLYREDLQPMRKVLGEQDAEGFVVEDFGMPVNLMLGCAATLVSGNFEDCLKTIVSYFKDGLA